MRSDVENSLVVMRAIFFDQLIGNQLIVTYGRACPYATLILLTVDNVIVNVYDTRFLGDEEMRDNGNGQVFLTDRRIEKILDAR